MTRSSIVYIFTITDYIKLLKPLHTDAIHILMSHDKNNCIFIPCFKKMYVLMLDYVRGLHRPGDLHLSKHESIYHNDSLYQNVTFLFFTFISPRL